MSIIKFCYYKLGKVNLELLRETMGMTRAWKRIFCNNMVELLYLFEIQINVYRIIESKNYEENKCNSVCNSKYQQLSVLNRVLLGWENS